MITAYRSPVGDQVFGDFEYFVGVPHRSDDGDLVAQIPHARILTRTSADPTVGFGTSTTRVSPGAVTTDTFISMLLYAGSWL
jgi:hypothetical protein